MSTVPFFFNHWEDVFTRGPGGRNTRSPNVVLDRGVASLVGLVMLADIAIADSQSMTAASSVLSVIYKIRSAI